MLYCCKLHDHHDTPQTYESRVPSPRAHVRMLNMFESPSAANLFNFETPTVGWSVGMEDRDTREHGVPRSKGLSESGQVRSGQVRSACRTAYTVPNDITVQLKIYIYIIQHSSVAPNGLIDRSTIQYSSTFSPKFRKTEEETGV